MRVSNWSSWLLRKSKYGPSQPARLTELGRAWEKEIDAVHTIFLSTRCKSYIAIHKSQDFPRHSCSIQSSHSKRLLSSYAACRCLAQLQLHLSHLASREGSYGHLCTASSRPTRAVTTTNSPLPTPTANLNRVSHHQHTERHLVSAVLSRYVTRPRRSHSPRKRLVVRNLEEQLPSFPRLRVVYATSYQDFIASLVFARHPSLPVASNLPA